MKPMSNDPDMLEEYDFSKGVRGISAQIREKSLTISNSQLIIDYYTKQVGVDNYLIYHYKL